jgi:hypothetical protein
MTLADTGGGYLNLVTIVLTLILAGTIFLEAWILKLFKYDTFGKALKDSAIVNIISLILGFVLFETLNFALNNNDISLIILFLITILIETLFLTFLDRHKNTKNTVIAGIVMNLASYAVLLFIILSFGGFHQ